MLRSAFFLQTTLALAAAAPEAVRFNRDVRPILAEQCLSCHGFDAKHRKADLRLDTRDGATAPHDASLPAITPGKPELSAAWLRIVSDDPDEVMPPPEAHRTPLSAQQKETLRLWIAQGAPYEPHWAFTPPQAPAVPPDASHPIDHFLAPVIATTGLSPAPQAPPATLIRRLSLDLTGLPPSPDQVKDFTAAYAANPETAWLHLTERLLASPHFGERWARWWLDQARYADSHGYSIDAPRQIWPYRDWVVNAFNTDLPFDQFTIAQLAGDLLPDATESQRIATGFHRNTQINQEGGIDPEQFRIDSVFDRVATTGTVWLGLSVGCAQCHDHKFDPIPQQEFYQLFAFFNQQDEPTLKVHGGKSLIPALEKELATLPPKNQRPAPAEIAAITTWESALGEAARRGFPDPVRKALQAAAGKRSPQQWQTLAATAVPDGPTATSLRRRAEIEAELNRVPSTLVLAERDQPRPTHIFIKGDFTRPGPAVSPGTPAILPPLQPRGTSPDRLDLARWIVSPANPLTARVIANRLWIPFFGRGLVESENDFGTQGTPPSHPELLDFLATQFSGNGWSIRHLIRLIVSSHAYRQSSHTSPEQRERDPLNAAFARQLRLRLDAELIRDTALAASGLLHPAIGGPPVYPPIPDGVMDLGQSRHPWPLSKGADRYRRGLYTFLFRATPPPSLAVFDAPEGFTSCTRRLRSNTPLQALTLMNDAAFVECAQALASIIRRDGLTSAFLRCTARPPRDAEIAILARLDAFTAARTLLNLDETITRE
jgi:hypothetical protein